MVTEREALLRSLTGVRQHVLDQLDGLDEAALRRPVLPSGWTALGLVRHLTLSDERYWFEVVVAGGPLNWWPEGDRADWFVGPDEPAAHVIADYRAAVAASDRILAAHALDASPAGREPDWPDDRFTDVRSVVQHVVVETATHAGQLDAVRELLDGRQYVVL